MSKYGVVRLAKGLIVSGALGCRARKEERSLANDETMPVSFLSLAFGTA
jgi:hypothetical protein